MTGQPQAYPLLARLRYAYHEGDKPLEVYENAWWEPRWGGGRMLGAVVDAMNHPRDPHRLSIRLTLNPKSQPTQMEASLLRPDGEGSATFFLEAESVYVEGIWNNIAFKEETSLPKGYTIAPHNFAADGLHFSSLQTHQGEWRLSSYHLEPRKGDRPFIGRLVTWNAIFRGEEAVTINGRTLRARRYRTTFDEAPGRPADFWIHDGYALQMTAQRSDGSALRVTCDRLSLSEQGAKP